MVFATFGESVVEYAVVNRFLVTHLHLHLHCALVLALPLLLPRSTGLLNALVPPHGPQTALTCGVPADGACLAPKSRYEHF